MNSKIKKATWFFTLLNYLAAISKRPQNQLQSGGGTSLKFSFLIPRIAFDDLQNQQAKQIIIPNILVPA